MLVALLDLDSVGGGREKVVGRWSSDSRRGHGRGGHLERRM